MQNNLSKIIGVSGRKYSGKDTLGEYLVKHHGYTRLAFADALKEATKNIFGFSDEQVYGNKKEEIDTFWKISPREVLQHLGTNIFRNNMKEILPNVGNDLWIYVVKRKILQKLEEEPDAKFVITDVRFPNEVDFIKSIGGMTIKLKRETEKNQFYNHESEMQIDTLVTTYEFDNNKSKEELFEQINLILSEN
jgi:hypothetical protein